MHARREGTRRRYVLRSLFYKKIPPPKKPTTPHSTGNGSGHPQGERRGNQGKVSCMSGVRGAGLRSGGFVCLGPHIGRSKKKSSEDASSWQCLHNILFYFYFRTASAVARCEVPRERMGEGGGGRLLRCHLLRGVSVPASQRRLHYQLHFIAGMRRKEGGTLIFWISHLPPPSHSVIVCCEVYNTVMSK